MKKKSGLRMGFSTGTAASAAAKGALLALFGEEVPDRVRVSLPGARTITVPLHRQEAFPGSGLCTVIKDGGDDPDVTNGAEIGVMVRRGARAGFVLSRGEGVGQVTKPGLPVPVGEPAINPVPRRMIRQAVSETLSQMQAPQDYGLEIEVFVPKGEEIARETLNPRLGILGGISILGTTGLVKPYSHGAYRATIHTELKVARATGLSEVIFTTGSTSDAYAMKRFTCLPEEAFVQMADYVGFSMEWAARMGFSHITVVCFMGKALKMAQGLPHTHASQGEVDLDLLSNWTLAITGNEELSQAVAHANTAREALEILLSRNALSVVDLVGKGMLQSLRKFAGPRPNIKGIILSVFQGAAKDQAPLLWEGRLKGTG